MKSRIFLALFAAIVAHPAAAQQTAAPQLTQPSSFRLKPRTASCTFGWQTTGVRYTVVGSTQLQPHLVLEEKTSIDQCENLEGPTSAEVFVTARPAAHPEARPVWLIRHRGEKGEVADEFSGDAMYRVTEYGCCGSEDLATYFSLRSGRRVFDADMALLYVDLRGFATAYVAVRDAQAASGSGDTTEVATVAFGVPDGSIQRAVIRGPSSDFAVSKAELVARGPRGQVKRGPKLDIDSDVGAGWMVAIALTIESMSAEPGHGQTVEIPIEGGRMAVEKARVPAPFRIGTGTR